MKQSSLIYVNSISNIAFRLANVLIGFFLTPYLLIKLGQEAYGLIPLVLSVATYINLLKVGVGAANGRYMTLALAKGNVEEGNEYFNTTFYAMLVGGIVVTIPLLLIANYFPDIFKVPGTLEQTSRYVFLIISLDILITIIFSPFTIGYIYRQKFYVQSIIQIGGQIIRIAIILLLFHFYAANVLIVAVGSLAGNLLVSVMSVRNAKSLIPSLRISVHLFRKMFLRRILSFGFFVTITHISLFIYESSNYIITNLCINVAAVTTFSMAARWNTIIRDMASSLIIPIVPLITINEANQHFDKINDVFIRGSQNVMFFILLPCVLMSIFGYEFILLWVGPEQLGAVPCLQILLLTLAISSGGMAASAVLTGLGHVRILSIIFVITAVSNIVISVTSVLVFKAGIVGVSIGIGAATLINYLILLPIHACKICRLRGPDYIKFHIKPFIGAIFLALCGLAAKQIIHIHSLISLIGLFIILSLIYSVFVFLFLLNASDKKLAINFLKKAIPFHHKIKTN